MSVSGAPTVPEPAAESGFKIERLYYTLDGEDADPAKAKQNQRFVVVLKITEPEAQFGRVHGRRLSAGGLRDRQPAAGLVGRDRHAVVDRERQGAGVFGVPRRAVQRGVRAAAEGTRRCSRWPMWCARCRRAVTCCRRPMLRTCTGRTLWAHRYGHHRDRAEVIAMKPVPHHPRRRRRRGYSPRWPVARGGCGRSARCRGSPTSSSRRRWSTATAGCCGPMRRRTAAGDCRRRVNDVDPRFVEMLQAYEDRRFRASRRRSLAMCARRYSSSAMAAIISGGSTLTMQVARLLEPRTERSLGAKLRQMVRAIEIERSSTSTRYSSFTSTLAPYGGNLEGIRAASLAYFGKEPKKLSLARSGAAGRAAAVAGAAAAGSLVHRGAGGARPRARPYRQGRNDSARTKWRSPSSKRVPDAAADAGAGAACRRSGGRGVARSRSCIG